MVLTLVTTEMHEIISRIDLRRPNADGFRWLSNFLDGLRVSIKRN